MSTPGRPFTVPKPPLPPPAAYQRGSITVKLWRATGAHDCFYPSLVVEGVNSERRMPEAECRAYLARHLRQLASEAEAMAREIEGGGPC